MTPRACVGSWLACSSWVGFAFQVRGAVQQPHTVRWRRVGDRVIVNHRNGF
jgi:hypothetical protein